MDFVNNEQFPIYEQLVIEIFAKIPVPDQEKIERACKFVKFIPEGEFEAEYCSIESEIRFYINRIEDFSKNGQRGIIAHEFGHACDHATRGIKGSETAEKMANMYAQQWGFYSYIRAMREETVNLRSQ